MEQTWMQDKRLEHIDQKKLDFLQKLVFELNEKTQSEKLPFLLALANRVKTEKISFDVAETQIIIAVIKDHSSSEQVERMNKILAFVSK